MNKTVVIIDDEPLSSELLKARLEKRGFIVFVCSNPLEVATFLRQHPPDVILLDVEMPQKNGFQVLSELRREFSSVELPVLMVTGHRETEIIVKSLATGANDYLSKPVIMDEALARIQTQLKLRELYLEGIKSKQLEAVTSLIVTYNHEINNPLTIGYAALAKLQRGEAGAAQKVKETLDRIRDQVKKIDALAQKELSFISYSHLNQMIDLASDDAKDPDQKK